MTPVEQSNNSIRSALIDSAIRQGRGGMLMNVMVVIGIGWLHFILTGESLPALWLVPMALVVALRSVLITWLGRGDCGCGVVARERMFVIPLVLMSLLWAFLPLVLFSTVGEDERLALAVIMAGMAGGAASVLAGIAWSARFYLACMLVPLSLTLFVHGAHGGVLGVLGFAYLGVILNTHRQARQMLIDALQGLEHNRQLSVTADAERVRAEQLNHELVAAQAQLQDQNDSLEEQVAERTEKMRLAAVAIENTAEGVMVTDKEATILEVNPAFTRITGYPPEAVLGQKSMLLRSSKQPVEFYEQIWERLRREGRWAGELWSCRQDGEAFLERRVVNSVCAADGTVTHYVNVLSDITETHLKDERIRHLAFHDALTGLPNRFLLDDRIADGIAVATRERSRLAILFIDLDQFKGVNDELGHHVGDLLLQQAAGRIQSRIRSYDTLARLGGDEFVILLRGVGDGRHCARVAEAVLEELQKPIEVLSHRLYISGSIGISMFPEDGTDGNTLMKNADTAMYEAKGAGRNTFRYFQAEMYEQTRHRRELESELRLAIDQGELELHYQAKVGAASSQVVGYEALLRWKSPQRGMVPPDEFIPLAEESGLIGRLGEWVIDRACRQIADWHAAGQGWQRVAINVSARQLLSDDVAGYLREAIQREGVPPHLIEVELTESVLMSRPDSAADALRTLKALGVTVAIDDFGTGYSSLAYLRRLPIDVLKIDRSFVVEAEADANGQAIIQTILMLGKTLNLVVVAEGVETARQADLLRTLGCDLLQGYYFARPLPSEQIRLAGSASAAVSLL